MKNSIHQLLIKLGLSRKGSAILYSAQTRDNYNVRVYKCLDSGCIFLENTDHISNTYYLSKELYNYWGARDRKESLKKTSTDDLRRKNQFFANISNKKWLDVGTGNGGLLELLSDQAEVAHAVEPQSAVRNTLNNLGFRVYGSIKETRDEYYDVITLFHVFEHMVNPLDELKEIYKKLKRGGLLIIEVPHARDILLDLYESESFKKFTLWSEHCILHTRLSLQKFLTHLHFKKIKISGFQRYPLSNHLYWLVKHQPNGQNIWRHLSSPKLDTAYANILETNDLTDTLIAVANK